MVTAFNAKGTNQSSRGKTLNYKHYLECCGNDISKKQRGLDPKWVQVNCYSADIKEASEMLHYQAKSPGIIIVGQNGQSQFKPDKPWSEKQGKKAPKYRTATGVEYNALLPKHPDDPSFWNNLEKVKNCCHRINGHPYIVVTEGAFKGISAMAHGIPTVALLGVEMGLTPAHKDPQGKRFLVPALELLAKSGFGFILAFDADIAQKGAVRLAMVKLAHQLLKFKVPVRVLPQWDEALGKGIDDFIQMNGIEKFRQELIARAIKFEEWSAIKNDSSEELRSNSQKNNNKIPKADILGGEIAEEYRSRWVFCDQYKNWLGYEVEFPGVWELISEDYLKSKIHQILKDKGIQGYGTNSYINNIIGAIKRELYLRKWEQRSSSELLPFQNGVLELATGKFHDHSPDFRLTWQLPRNYNLLSLDC